MEFWFSTGAFILLESIGVWCLIICLHDLRDPSIGFWYRFRYIGIVILLKLAIFGFYLLDIRAHGLR